VLLRGGCGERSETKADPWRVKRAELVEAAGIEPFSHVNPNPMMSHDFGFYDMKTFGLQRRFDSPGVPYSPLESSPVLEK
jgi:hypothetical protein